MPVSFCFWPACPHPIMSFLPAFFAFHHQFNTMRQCSKDASSSCFKSYCFPLKVDAINPFWCYMWEYWKENHQRRSVKWRDLTLLRSASIYRTSKFKHGLDSTAPSLDPAMLWAKLWGSIHLQPVSSLFAELPSWAALSKSRERRSNANTLTGQSSEGI